MKLRDILESTHAQDVERMSYLATRIEEIKSHGELGDKERLRQAQRELNLLKNKLWGEKIPAEDHEAA